MQVRKARLRIHSLFKVIQPVSKGVILKPGLVFPDPVLLQLHHGIFPQNQIYFTVDYLSGEGQEILVVISGLSETD